MSDQGRQFCSKCGLTLQQGASFCSACGHPVTPSAPSAAPVQVPDPPQPQYAQAPQQEDPRTERVYSVLGGVSYKKGALKRMPCSLVMTQYRIVFAELTKDMLKLATVDAKTQAKTDGKGLFRQLGAQMGASRSAAERYRTITADQALMEGPNNFAIDRSQVKKVKFKMGDEDTDVIVIKTTAGKYVLEIKNGSVRNAKKALAEAGLV